MVPGRRSGAGAGRAGCCNALPAHSCCPRRDHFRRVAHRQAWRSGERRRRARGARIRAGHRDRQDRNLDRRPRETDHHRTGQRLSAHRSAPPGRDARPRLQSRRRSRAGCRSGKPRAAARQAERSPGNAGRRHRGCRRWPARDRRRRRLRQRAAGESLINSTRRTAPGRCVFRHCRGRWHRGGAPHSQRRDTRGRAAGA